MPGGDSLRDELLRRCADLIHIGNHDEAVRSACMFLEERLRKAAHKEELMGVRLVNHAFDPGTGPLAAHLASRKSEREGLYYLYTGAFKLLRNPTAHGVVGYSAAEAKAIVGFVNLLLTFGVINFNLEQLSENLRDLGFAPTGKHRDFQISLKERNDQAFFDALYDLVEQTSQELEKTLS